MTTTSDTGHEVRKTDGLVIEDLGVSLTGRNVDVVDDIDLVEMNEAFAAVVLRFMADTGFDHEQVNVNGGAIALGHTLGCSGARLMTTLIHQMRTTGSRYGLQTMCEGGGMANATILELL